MNEEENATAPQAENTETRPEGQESDSAEQKRKRQVTPVSIWESSGDGAFRRRKDLTFPDTASAEKWRAESGTAGFHYAILRVYSVAKIPQREVIEVTDY